MNALFGDIAEVAGDAVTLTDGRTARFDPADRRAPALTSVLEDLRQQRNPVYLELDPATGFVSRVRIPLIVRVESITEGRDDVEVRLIRSHARHVVRRDNPNAKELLRTLQAAGGEQSLAVTTTDSGEIVDVRPYPRG